MITDIDQSHGKFPMACFVLYTVIDCIVVDGQRWARVTAVFCSLLLLFRYLEEGLPLYIHYSAILADLIVH